MRQRYNPRLAKSHRCYTLQQAAELYGCHKNTISNWTKQGLETLGNSRPILIHGTELNAFHASRRKSSKRPCGEGEIYCFTCKTPRRPELGLVEVMDMPGAPMVRAVCPSCESIICQRVNAERLKHFLPEHWIPSTAPDEHSR